MRGMLDSDTLMFTMRDIDLLAAARNRPQMVKCVSSGYVVGS